MITLHQLRIFWAVAHAESLTRASKLLGLAQPSLSQQIAKLLGVVDSEGNSIVHRDRRCLSCHSSMPVDQMALKGDLVQEETQRNPRYTIGVSCEACHGPAGKRADGAEGWGAAHSKPHDQDDPSTTWRALSPQTKFDEFGYH